MFSAVFFEKSAVATDANSYEAPNTFASYLSAQTHHKNNVKKAV